VGRAHHANLYLQHPRARRTGFYHGSELSVYLALALRFAPVLCRYKIDATPLGKRGKGLEFRWEDPALRLAPPRCPKPSPPIIEPSPPIIAGGRIIPSGMGLPLLEHLACLGRGYAGFRAGSRRSTVQSA
jgi:hypothetical protein